MPPAFPRSHEIPCRLHRTLETQRLKKNQEPVNPSLTMEDPWADSAGASDPLGTSTQQSTDDNTTAAASTVSTTSATTAGSGAAPASSSSTSRPSRATPRRLVAQPTRLEAVEDDPLGPLGSASAPAKF